MRRLDNLPLQQKFTLLVMSICGAVLLAACAALALHEHFEFRRAMARDMTMLADVLGKNAQAALAFDDAEAAAGLLRALAAEPDVAAARVFGHGGEPFADYLRADVPASGLPARPLAVGHRFTGSHLALFRPIDLDGERFGTIYLQVGLQGLYQRLVMLGGITAAVLGGSLLLAWILSASLQRLVSGPILALARTAGQVAERNDYTVRAPRQGENELGRLTDAFNHMLDRIQAQNRALKIGEERVRSVVDAAISAVVVADADGTIRDWNVRAERLFGWTRAEAIGRQLAATIIPARQRAGQGPGFPQTASGADILTEVNVLRRDGSEFPAELSVSRLQDGGAINHCGFITDITGRKQAEIRLREQMTRLDLLNRITRAIGERLDLKSIFQVVVRSLEDNLAIDFGCVCLHDPTAASFTVSSVGMRSEELATDLARLLDASLAAKGQGMARCVAGQLVYEPDLARLDLPFARQVAEAGARALVVAPLLVESKTIGVLVVARRAAGSFTSVECEFLRQLGEHVALAAHQAQLYIALQQAYDDLRQTQQAVMQQERLRALGQMASGIAHDINNAISPIALYTESLLEREPGLSARARDQLETIKRAIEDVAHTVARMGEFYRQRESQPLLVPVQLNDMVRQVLDLTSARWSDMPQQRGLMVRSVTELVEGLPEILAVASEIREALINLVFNAVDAMPEGGTLTLRTRLLPGDGGNPARALVEVVDGGVGMDEATRRRCLEPFFTTKGERGTGLGLAMVYGVMQRHNSEIEIDSTPGKGTTMRLLFPLPPVAVAAGAAPVMLIPTRLRLLVVDDDPLLLKSLRSILEGDGHVVVTADRGQGGIDSFRSSLATGERFAAVITDLGMPYVDGRQVASAIKGMSPTTPVIMLTGWGQRLVADGDIPPHVDRVLNKPPKLSELRDALARSCAGGTRRD